MKTIKLGNLNGYTGGSFHGMVYDSDGLAPTLNSMQGGGTQPMIVELKRFGNIYGEEFGTGYAGNVWDKEGLCPTIKVEGAGGNRQPMIIEDNDPVIVASRGRNPENPSDRTAGAHLEQRLEPNMSGLCNTITSVEKDSYVLERDMGYRIRKLTPRECGRLMDVSDEDIDKMEAVMSKTQLYRQFGNSICCNVLVAIFGQLFNGKEDIYKMYGEI